MAEQTKFQINQPFKTVNNLLSKIDSIKNIRQSKKFYLIILIFGILLLFIFKKSWFVAATVSGIPITSLELQAKLNQQFKSQVLNQLINEKILLNEAAKLGAIPQDIEINTRIEELEKSVGGPDLLDTLLAQQNQTRVTLKDQVRLQLTISKLYDKEATVSAEEVTKFLEQNRSALQATESAKQEEEAFNFIKQQKISEIFNQKFQELRTKAKIQIF